MVLRNNTDFLETHRAIYYSIAVMRRNDNRKLSVAVYIACSRVI